MLLLLSLERAVIQGCIFFFFRGSGSNSPFTAHWLNTLLWQPHQLVSHATYQTDTCRRNYGMSVARLNPNIRRQLVSLSNVKVGIKLCKVWHSGKDPDGLIVSVLILTLFLRAQALPIHSEQNVTFGIGRCWISRSAVTNVAPKGNRLPPRTKWVSLWDCF